MAVQNLDKGSNFDCITAVWPLSQFMGNKDAVVVVPGIAFISPRCFRLGSPHLFFVSTCVVLI